MAKAKNTERTATQQLKHDANREENLARAESNKKLVHDKGLDGFKRPSKLVRQYKRTQMADYAERVKRAETERKKIEQKAKDDAAREKRKAAAKAERDAKHDVDLSIDVAVTLTMLGDRA